MVMGLDQMKYLKIYVKRCNSGGNSSYRFSQQGFRRPFKIDTNRFTKGLKWFGKTKLNLSNSFKDSTYLREKLGYEIFHAAGLPTPGVGWAHVWLTIDGQHLAELERRHCGRLTFRTDPGLAREEVKISSGITGKEIKV